MSARSLAAALLALVACLALSASALAAAPPHINHLFVIVLENENAEESFGANPPAPYLGADLPKAGAFMPNYYGIGHASLDNYIAMISGQPPNLVTQADCTIFSEMAPGIVGADGIALGQGYVFPKPVQTVANQLEGAGHSWRGYMEDMANGAAAGEATTCRHPAIGTADKTLAARPNDQYATRHDPFVYFHSIIDTPACQSNVVDLSKLPGDLSSLAKTPEYSFITPDLCADGHDATCADGVSPGGFAGVDAFLRQWVPAIQASPAYQDQGAILVTFDESESGADSCCGEVNGPNTPNNGGGNSVGSGGGRIGAVMLSPCIKPGTVTNIAYNHYSMLRWVEDNFGVPHLANAATAGLTPFGADVLSRADCQKKTKLRARPRKAVSGHKTAFKFSFTTELDACVKGAVVSFAGHRTRTNAHGKAQIKATLHGKGHKVATVKSPICDSAKASVRIVQP